jgi:hypothetical protein
MIVLFTDFGPSGPYLGQMSAVLHREAPGVPVVTLLADAPAHDPRSSAYLLSAYVRDFPRGAVFLCVVDPGVGSGLHRPMAIEIDGRWFVGPGNGLFEIVARRGRSAHAWAITWRPRELSATFHGRDLYAPEAARLARGEGPRGVPVTLAPDPSWPDDLYPDDLYQVIYLDHYGNCITGVRATAFTGGALLLRGRPLPRARTFAEVPGAQPFFYENSNGLIEIAVRDGRAGEVLGIGIGEPIAAA